MYADIPTFHYTPTAVILYNDIYLRTDCIINIVIDVSPREETRGYSIHLRVPGIKYIFLVRDIPGTTLCAAHIYIIHIMCM